MSCPKLRIQFIALLLLAVSQWNRLFNGIMQCWNRMNWIITHWAKSKSPFLIWLFFALQSVLRCTFRAFNSLWIHKIMCNNLFICNFVGPPCNKLSVTYLNSFSVLPLRSLTSHWEEKASWDGIPQRITAFRKALRWRVLKPRTYWKNSLYMWTTIILELDWKCQNEKLFHNLADIFVCLKPPRAFSV